MPYPGPSVFPGPSTLPGLGSGPTFGPYNPLGLTNVMRYVGSADVPRSVRMQRANNLDTMRRLGSPVIVKHMFTDLDYQNSVALKSPNFSDTYGQPRHGDPISHGVGYVGIPASTNEWVSPTGALVISATDPGGGHVPAPRYRGFGPGYLMYMIMPDAAEDVFKLSEAGALMRVQTAQAQTSWFPEINDNDLIITCQIDEGERVITTFERYQAKMTNPISIRGLDRRGRREYTEDFGNRNVTDQNFEMVLIPHRDELYNVETDR